MANSFVRYTGNAVTTAFAIPFSYISAIDLTVTEAGVPTVAYTLDGAGTLLTFDTAPADTVAIEIRRTTSQTTRLTDYADGSVLTENDLDTDSTQAFYMSQEAIDTASDQLVLSNVNFQYDAGGKRITNVGDPVDAQDAVTKAFISTNLPDILTVAGIAADVSTVAADGADIGITAANSVSIATVANNIGDVNTVAADIVKVIAVADDLAEAVSEVETVADDLNEAVSEIDTVAQNIVNVNLVGLAASEVTAVAGSIANVNTVAPIVADVTTVAGISADVTAVAAIDANVTAVAGDATNIGIVATDIANVNTVGTNMAEVNTFAEQYRIAAADPVTSLNQGDLYFNTVANELRVYKTTLGWVATDSTINGTADRYYYTATGGQTTFTGADNLGNTLSYDANEAEVYLNGVKLSYPDIDITSGTSVVLTSGATIGDTMDIVAFAAINLASLNADNILAGTLADARLTSEVTLNTAVQTLTNKSISGSTNTVTNLANAALTNSEITINATPVSLGGSIVISTGDPKPTITSILPTAVTDNVATDVVITGTNFGATGIPNVEIINSNGAISYPNTIARDSATQLTINVTIAVAATYFLRIELEGGEAVRSSTAILNASAAPVISTVAGSLGSFELGSVISVTIAGTGDPVLAWSIVGTLPTGLSLNTATGEISGTESSGNVVDTTYASLVTTLTDGDLQTDTKTFSITITMPVTEATGGGQFN
jgi:hypothetical protein